MSSYEIGYRVLCFSDGKNVVIFMKIKYLETFISVAERQNFHHAADDMHVTQSTVSSRIKSLEERLDSELFERSPKGAKLTEAGCYLKPYAEQIVCIWNDLKVNMK